MEKFYILMGSQAWAEILVLVKNEQTQLRNNALEWKRISALLESEFIKYAGTEKSILIAKLCNDYIKLVLSGYLEISQSGIMQIESIGFKASLEQSESEALIFSKICNHYEEALNFQSSINTTKFEETSVSNKSHSSFARTDWLIPLFKSEQEEVFYEALKSTYPNFFIYPNVAVNNIFDFEQIKPHLQSSERDYFLKAIIDFVVYDPSDHTPKFFFEVDSCYHDSAEARIRDNKKNNIFNVAGIKLHRIRLNSDTLMQKYDFMQEIKLVTA
ncbi:DUF2726 domain-containing protein [Aliivibrio sp. S10_S31]|uniref:DUF2726 domain-containing protein n=1 Tax=Aliivibrio sp. S10_S31 TaxID=2720224 RepID=UPI001680308B|nr:DUF2726 domain-containing protein [Aliivibrio sp. S10_S31]MBD1571608.1 DUF2726 domain-containing protein [Aliivibrio sp. S10_S31]